MDALGSALVLATLAPLAAVLLERLAALALRRAWQARRPLSAGHLDEARYERGLGRLDADMRQVGALLAVAGLLAAATLHWPGWPAWPAALLWLGALGWDLWTWERVGVSVKFVAWRRGWRRTARRVAISELRDVSIVDGARPRAAWSARLQPPTCGLQLTLRDGKSVRLPLTGAWFGGARQVEGVANYVRRQMDIVADNRRRAIADKRSAARRAQLEPLPMHPASKIDPLALNRGGPA